MSDSASQVRFGVQPSSFRAIAEGQGRLNVGEFKQFLGIARGSNYEVQTQLELAKALRFAPCAEIENAENLSHEVGKMIYALIESL